MKEIMLLGLSEKNAKIRWADWCQDEKKKLPFSFLVLLPIQNFHSSLMPYSLTFHIQGRQEESRVMTTKHGGEFDLEDYRGE